MLVMLWQNSCSNLLRPSLYNANYLNVPALCFLSKYFNFSGIRKKERMQIREKDNKIKYKRKKNIKKLEQKERKRNKEIL